MHLLFLWPQEGNSDLLMSSFVHLVICRAWGIGLDGESGTGAWSLRLWRSQNERQETNLPKHEGCHTGYLKSMQMLDRAPMGGVSLAAGPGAWELWTNVTLKEYKFQIGCPPAVPEAFLWQKNSLRMSGLDYLFLVSSFLFLSSSFLSFVGIEPRASLLLSEFCSYETFTT